MLLILVLSIFFTSINGLCNGVSCSLTNPVVPNSNYNYCRNLPQTCCTAEIANFLSEFSNQTCGASNCAQNYETVICNLYCGYQVPCTEDGPTTCKSIVQNVYDNCGALENNTCVLFTDTWSTFVGSLPVDTNNCNPASSQQPTTCNRDWNSNYGWFCGDFELNVKYDDTVTQYVGTVNPVMGGDPSSTIELEWFENGIPMRWNIYFQQNATHYWSDEIRTYGQTTTGDWFTFAQTNLRMFETPLNNTYSCESFEYNVQQGTWSAQLLLKNFKLLKQFTSGTQPYENREYPVYQCTTPFSFGSSATQISANLFFVIILLLCALL